MASPVAAEWARSRPRREAPYTTDRIGALVLGDPTPHLARALQDSDQTVTRWHRFLTPGQQCTPWPPPGPFDEVWVRMPRSSLEAAMLLHAAAARVEDGASIHLFGAGEEGIRSAAKHFPAGTGEVRTALIKRRCRVLVVTREAPPPRADGLDSWQTDIPIDWGDGARQWTFYPGVFAHGPPRPGTPPCSSAACRASRRGPASWTSARAPGPSRRRPWNAAGTAPRPCSSTPTRSRSPRRPGTSRRATECSAATSPPFPGPSTSSSPIPRSTRASHRACEPSRHSFRKHPGFSRRGANSPWWRRDGCPSATSWARSIKRVRRGRRPRPVQGLDGYDSAGQARVGLPLPYPYRPSI